MSTQVQNKPTAAYILALISGILGVLTALGIIVSGILTYTTFSEWTNYYNGYYYSDYYSSGLFGWSWTMLIGVGIWFLIASMLVIVFARKLNSNPLEHTKWGGTNIGLLYYRRRFPRFTRWYTCINLQAYLL